MKYTLGLVFVMLSHIGITQQDSISRNYSFGLHIGASVRYQILEDNIQNLYREYVRDYEQWTQTALDYPLQNPQFRLTAIYHPVYGADFGIQVSKRLSVGLMGTVAIADFRISEPQNQLNYRHTITKVRILPFLRYDLFKDQPNKKGGGISAHVLAGIGYSDQFEKITANTTAVPPKLESYKVHFGKLIVKPRYAVMAALEFRYTFQNRLGLLGRISVGGPILQTGIVFGL